MRSPPQLVVGLAFLLGTIVGGGATVLIGFRVVDGAVAFGKSSSQTSARLAASRAWCAGRFLDAVPYEWTVATLASIKDSNEVKRNLSVLVALAEIAEQQRDSHAEILRRGDEMFARSKLAVILDRAGLPALSAVQWSAASSEFARINKHPSKELIVAALDRECGAKTAGQ